MKNFFEFLKANLRLVLGLLGATIGLLWVQFHVHTSADKFLGVADSKEIAISFESPVTVKRVLVLPGERVKQGQPLIEVVPTEVNLKLVELRAELDVLESERRVRSTLLGGLGRSQRISEESPIARAIEGVKAQIRELQKQQSLAVRFAEADGIVATVAYRAREQVAPFTPVITLISESPDLVYGFLHEKRASAYRIGGRVQVVPLADKARAAEGQIVSMGSRITPFPDRFQDFVSGSPQHFGREVLVRISPQNRILAGEKVQIQSSQNSLSESLNFITIADASESKINTETESILKGLSMEIGGLAYDEGLHSFVVASDDHQKGHSPFWRVAPEKGAKAVNLTMKGLGKIEDVEALSRTENGYFYALASLSSEGKNSKRERDLLIRFVADSHSVQVDRSLDLRTPLLEALEGEGLLQRLDEPLSKIEVESLSVWNGEAYVGLKKPRLLDGSSVILKLHDFESRVDDQDLRNLDVSIHAIVRLSDPSCSKASRITDLHKTSSALLILGNCKKEENRGQVWRLKDSFPTLVPTLLFKVQNSHPEGLALLADGSTFYISSDNGNKEGSEIIRVKQLEN